MYPRCEEERGAEGRTLPRLVVQFLRVGTPCAWLRRKRREQGARKAKDRETYKTVYTHTTWAPLKNYLFLAAPTVASTEIPSIGLILTRAARRRA